MYARQLGFRRWFPLVVLHVSWVLIRDPTIGTTEDFLTTESIRYVLIEGRQDDTLDAPQSVLKWCQLLSKAPAHVVLICQPNDHTSAHMGELSSETLAYKNVLGYIVDGGCRDSAFIEKLGFPVFCGYYTPLDIVGKWRRNCFRASYYNRRCHHSFWRLRVS
jgi:hypothetical protein